MLCVKHLPLRHLQVIDVCSTYLFAWKVSFFLEPIYKVDIIEIMELLFSPQNVLQPVISAEVDV